MHCRHLMISNLIGYNNNNSNNNKMAEDSNISQSSPGSPSLSSSQITRLAINREVASARLRSSRFRCCKCCSTGKCKRCSCARSGARCVDCYPSKYGICSNIQSQPNADLLNQEPGHIPEVPQPDFPPLSSILGADARQIPTARHIPKAARNAWASALTATLNNLVATPDSIVE